MKSKTTTMKDLLMSTLLYLRIGVINDIMSTCPNKCLLYSVNFSKKGGRGGTKVPRVLILNQIASTGLTMILLVFQTHGVSHNFCFFDVLLYIDSFLCFHNKYPIHAHILLDRIVLKEGSFADVFLMFLIFFTFV